MSKKKQKTLSLYQVAVEYQQPMNLLIMDLDGFRRQSIHTITVVAYNKKEAVRRTMEQLMYVDRPFRIVKIKKATTRKEKERKKHDNKMPFLFPPCKKEKKPKKAKKVNFITF